MVIGSTNPIPQLSLDINNSVCSGIEKLGGRVEEIAFVIELPSLNGREKLKKWNVFSIVGFEDS